MGKSRERPGASSVGAYLAAPVSSYATVSASYGCFFSMLPLAGGERRVQWSSQGQLCHFLAKRAKRIEGTRRLLLFRTGGCGGTSRSENHALPLCHVPPTHCRRCRRSHIEPPIQHCEQ
jgi:hypothetical protein